MGEIRKEWDVIQQKYNQFKEAGVELTPQMNRVGALAKLRSLDSEIEKITSIQYKKATKKNEADNVAIFQTDVTKVVNEVADYCNSLKEFAVTEAEIAYYYCSGQALYEHSQKARNLPIPKEGLKENVQAQYELQYAVLIEQLAAPIESASKARLLNAQGVSEKLETWTEWNTRALNTLALLDPTTYKVEKEEKMIFSNSEYVSMESFASMNGTVPYKEFIPPIEEEESDEEESDEVESDEEESDEVESDEVESDEVESDEVESDEVESDEVESDEEESQDTGM